MLSEAFATQLSRDDMVSSISGFLDSLWECESDGDGFGTSVSILDVASYI